MPPKVKDCHTGKLKDEENLEMLKKKKNKTSENITIWNNKKTIGRT